jgi:hypothetical protein
MPLPGISGSHASAVPATAAGVITPANAMILAILGLGLLTSTTQPARASRIERPRAAHTARTLNATDTAHLHLVKSPGSLILEEGSASGALPGTVKARCDVGPTITASFTIYTRDGAISGRGSGKLNSSGAEPSFAGTMTVTSGTGRYAHAYGHGGFYGVLNRHTLALTIQTTGTLSY